MKKITLLLFFFISALSFAQNFDKKWEEVVLLENDGKIKSANQKVELIYKKANSDRNEAQIIKCFFYKSKYMLTLEEDAQSKIIKNLENEITRASIPSKALLNLIYARILNPYLNNSKYKIHERTPLDSTEVGNFSTWSRNDFEKQIEAAYTNTLKEEAVLKNTPLKKYEQLFDFFSQDNFNSTSLYDYMIQANIDHYTTKINEWENQWYDINLSKALLGSNEEFRKLNLDSIKNRATKKVLLLHQRANLTTKPTELELDRLLFSNKYILKSNNQLLKSLISFQKRCTDVMLIQKVQLEKATLLEKIANKNEFLDYNTKAVTLLDSILLVPNKSNAFKKATLLKKQITTSFLTLQTLQYTYENENTRAFINYKNCDSIKIAFYKIDAKSFQKEIINDSIGRIIAKKNLLYKSQKYYLQNKKDYFEYTTEVILPQLEIGNYFMVVRNLNKESSDNTLHFSTISVSNSSIMGYQEKDLFIYQALDRRTGKPLTNCQLKSDSFNITTNKNGIAEVKLDSKKSTSDYRYKDITFINQKDTLVIKSPYLNSLTEYDNDSESEEINARVKFYLDRAIYRPGQTIYYKGIATQTKNKKNKILANFLLNIKIKDANYKDVKTFEVTTNEFGSFSGEYILPKTGLTGEYRISADEPEDIEKDVLYNKKEDEHPIWDNGDFEESEIIFNVEEYKRPKFEVIFEPTKEPYTLNQTIKAKGNAKAFAGSSISDAKVVYRVERKVFYDWRNPYANDSKNIITSETKTDASGNFTIDFVAVPDDAYDKTKLPVFSYKITADITDSNGETHSAETTIKVGYHTLSLQANLPPNIDIDKKNSLYLNSTNLNNQFVAVDGEVQIYFLRNFENKFKRRVFEKPEIESISEAEFNRLFPFENNQKIIDQNEKGTLVYTQKVNTEKDKAIEMDFISKYKSGYYKVVFLAIDQFKNPITTSSQFQLFNSKEKKSNGNELVTLRQLNGNPLKDGFVKIQINTAVPNLYLTCVGSQNNKLFFEENIEIKNYEGVVMVPINKKTKTSFIIAIETIYDNQYYKADAPINLKEELVKTTIEIESFRNKLEPGKEENWSFKIKENNQRVEFEALASMYDSSLDQFSMINWEPLTSSNRSYNRYYGKSALAFGRTYTSFTDINFPSSPFEYQNEYNKLMWFGFDFNNTTNPSLAKEYKKQITKKASKPANTKMISGIVTDETGPLPNANVMVKGTTRAVQTDFAGHYEIEAAKGEILVFSFIGMDERTFEIAESKVINIFLRGNSQQLSEVVVGALGIRKNKDVLTSGTQVVQEDNELYGRYELTSSLAGKVSGVQVSATTGSSSRIILRGNRSVTGNNNALVIIDGAISSADVLASLPPETILSINVLKGAESTALYGTDGANGAIIVTTKNAIKELTQVKTRTNRNETAFFFPQLKTDKDGRIKFQFTTPEELTEWKMRLFAHNKKANFGYLEKTVVTQKKLMVFPNMPRFLRENDTIYISAKVSNLTPTIKNGIALLQLFDASTMENIDSKMMNTNAIKNFTIAPTGNTVVSWKIVIPSGLQGVQYKVIAKSDNYSDGEESILPVLTNNILVTESIPIWVRENSTKEYVFENLKNNTSTTLRNHQFTLEYTSNPTWLAIQSLPYLMEYEHECAEQTFSRYYANVLATEIINSNPKIAAVFEDWKKSGKSISKLEQNEELKSMILAETPWMNDAQSEDEKRKKMVLLFDLDQMKTSLETVFQKLKDKQKPSGGFAWFDGGEENEYITRHIVAGLGHLQKLSANKETTSGFAIITKSALPYLDTKYIENNKLIDTRKSWSNPYTDLHYLYMRSYYLQSNPISEKVKTIANVQLLSIKENWLNYSIYNKGMAALILHRFGDTKAGKKILENLKETSSNNEDWGMYWIANKPSWYWYEAPIETQALLIEAFAEIANDTKSVDAMKVWLLKNKQTKNWPTTKSTTEAIYALLLQGTDWLSVKDNTKIKIGDKKIQTSKLSVEDKEAETGYIKMNWKNNEVTKDMANISIENKSKVPGYGGVYWQYFEDLDHIKTSDKSVMTVAKELYLKTNTNEGQKLKRITANNPLKIGDLVTVRLVITTKEDMEYVHLKDMRASCFEPISVLSEYEWKDNLGFYRSTKDAATHFFFDRINKGTYVIEYDIRVNNKGEFSNGITTIESMYAPEFTSRTKGIRVQVEE